MKLLYDRTCKLAKVHLDPKVKVFREGVRSLELSGAKQVKLEGTKVFKIKCPFVLKPYDLAEPEDFPVATNFYIQTSNDNVGSVASRIYLLNIDEDNLPISESLVNNSIADVSVGNVPIGMYADQRTEKIYFSTQDPTDLAKYYIYQVNFDGTGLTLLRTLGNSTYNANHWTYDSKNERIWFGYSIDDPLSLPGRWNVYLKYFEVSSPLTDITVYSNTNDHIAQQIRALSIDRENEILYIVYSNIDGQQDTELFQMDMSSYIFTKVKTWTGVGIDSHMGRGVYGNGKFYHGGSLGTDVNVTDIATGLDQVFVNATNLGLGNFQQGLFFDSQALRLYFTQQINNSIWRVEENGSGLTEVARVPRSAYYVSLGND